MARCNAKFRSPQTMLQPVLSFLHRQKGICSKEAATLKRRSNFVLNFPSRSAKAKSFYRSKAVPAGGLALLMLLTGCQSFQPLRNATHQQVQMARQWTQGGIEALQCGRLKQAKSCFSQAAAHNPNDQIVQANLARAVSRDGDSVKAINHMIRAVELSGNEPRLVVELGELYLQAGQWLPARRQAELALEIDRRFAPAWALQGKTNLAKGELDDALSDFQRAIGLDPGLCDVQLAIIETYQRKHQPLRALAAVENFLSQFPRDQQPEAAVIAKSIALMELDQPGPAIDLLEVASRRSDASSEVFLRLGQAQLKAGRISQARLTLSQAKSAFPEEPVFDSLLSELQTVTSRIALIEPSVIR